VPGDDRRQPRSALGVRVDEGRRLGVVFVEVVELGARAVAFAEQLSAPLADGEVGEILARRSRTVGREAGARRAGRGATPGLCQESCRRAGALIAAPYTPG
jgi:hypothetical protein